MISKEDYHRSSRKVGRNLRRIRLQKGLKQIEVAIVTGLNRTYISRIETGKASITENLLYVLCKGLKIRSSELIEF